MIDRRTFIASLIAARFVSLFDCEEPPPVEDEESSVSHMSCCGCSASPIVFDDALITGALLHGDFFPTVTTLNVTRRSK